MLLDSDMLVTRCLDDVITLARERTICVFADHRAAHHHSFAE